LTPDFIKRQLVFFVLTIFFSFLLFGLHWYLLSHFFENVYLIIPLWSIYVFHGITVLIIYTVCNYIFSSQKGAVLFWFVGGTMLKMILALVFLLPLFLKKPENKILEAFNFIIPYFLYLAFEIFNITYFLRKSNK